MQISIEKTESGQQEEWHVHLGDHSVSFGTQASAEQFRTQLLTRIQAPHPLPESAGDTDRPAEDVSS